MTIQQTVHRPVPVFEPMTLKDVDAVLAIEQRIHVFPWTRGHFVDSLVSGYRAQVLRLDGCLAGYAIVMMTPDDAQLLDIGIDLPWQRQGWGAYFLHHLLIEAQASAVPRMLLEVRASNQAALALYGRCGFTQIGVRRHYYSGAAGREDALVLECLLSAEQGKMAS